MRLIARCFGLCMILVLSMMIFSQFMMFNVISDQLTTSLSSAISSTQILISEQIEDQLLQTNNARMIFDSNEKYLDVFVKHFRKLTDDKENYYIKVYGIDYTKGFIDIGVDYHLKMFNGEIKVISTRKTSIIDIINKEAL